MAYWAEDTIAKEEEWLHTQNRMRPETDPLKQYRVDQLTFEAKPECCLSRDVTPYAITEVVPVHMPMFLKETRSTSGPAEPLTKEMSIGMFGSIEDDFSLHSDVQALTIAKPFHLNRAVAQEIYRRKERALNAAQPDPFAFIKFRTESTVSDPYDQYSVFYCGPTAVYQQHCEAVRRLEQSMKDEMHQENLNLRGRRRNYVCQLQSGLRSTLELNPTGSTSKLEGIQSQDETLGLKINWYPFPSTMKGIIVMKDPKDIGFTLWLLNNHGLQCKPLKRHHPTNQQINVSVSPFLPYAHDSRAFEHAMKTILDGNELKYESVRLLRHSECGRLSDSSDDERIEFEIHRRIGRSAMAAEVWETVAGENLPVSEPSWKRYVTRHKSKFPWTVTLDSYVNPFVDEEERINRLKIEAERKNPDEFHGYHKSRITLESDDPRLAVERSATVMFKNNDYYRRVMDHLLSLPPGRDTFSLARNDVQGARFEPICSIRRHVPAIVRTVIHNSLLQLDGDLRAQSDGGYWCRFVDDIIKEQITVEGWPKEFVREAANRLENYLRGFVIDCSELAGALLQGVGLVHVNNVQRMLEGQVVISMNRLQKEIVIIGDSYMCQQAEEMLLDFCMKPEEFAVAAKIDVREPRFLYKFQECIRKMIETNPSSNELYEVLNRPTRLYWAEKAIYFEGTVSQYERLQGILDQQQQKMLDVYKSDVKICDKFKDIQFRQLSCSVCLHVVSPANYRLSICGHIYCVSCLCRMIYFYLKARQLPIRCQHKIGEAECDEFIALGDILNLLMDSNFRHYPHFFQDRLELLLNATTDYAVQQSQGALRPCSRADCAGILQKRQYGITHVMGFETKCGVCHASYCSNCFNPPHPEHSCEIEDSIRKSGEMSLNHYMAKNSDRVKHCPNLTCGVIIEKEAGCNHMHCQRCNIHFCWICSFQGPKESTIYQHLSAVHGGTGGGWDHLDDPRGGDWIPVDDFDDDGFADIIFVG